MVRWTFLYAETLIAVGLGGYFGTGRVSPTALIPAFFGLVVLGIAFWSRREASRKHAMHAAAGLALLAFAGSASGLYKVALIAAGETVARPAAAFSQAIMASLSLIYLLLCIRSFVQARRNSTAA